MRLIYMFIAGGIARMINNYMNNRPHKSKGAYEKMMKEYPEEFD